MEVTNQLGPNAAQMSGFTEGTREGPVVMLNLLKYRDIAESGYGVDGLTGRQAYTKYGEAFAELEPRFGGSVMWMGRGKHTVIGGDENWDIIILVTYPTRRQFIDMFNDPDYQAIAPMRAAALADSRIVESTQLVPRLAG